MRGERAGSVQVGVQREDAGFKLWREDLFVFLYVKFNMLESAVVAGADLGNHLVLLCGCVALQYGWNKS